MPRLFGTDGVRGKAGAFPLDQPTVRRLGGALVRVLRHDGAVASDGRPIRFLAGRDTRESGTWIEQALAAGMAGEGGSLASAGVVPTPAIAYVTPREGFTAGVVISASHNPFEDNGIKVFSGAGEKFTEVLGAAGRGRDGRPVVDGVGRARRRGRGGLSRRIRAPSRRDPAGAPAPARDADCGGLRQRRDDDGGAAGVRAPRLRHDVPRRRARRAQHQPALRLHPSAGSRRSGRRRRLRDGHRVRRRRRSRDLRRRVRADRGRRRRHADVRQGPQGRGPSQGRRRRGHGDEQHRAGDRAA